MLRPVQSGRAGAEGQRADRQTALQGGARPVPLEARLVHAGRLHAAFQPGRRGGQGGGTPTETAAGAQ